MPQQFLFTSPIMAYAIAMAIDDRRAGKEELLRHSQRIQAALTPEL